MVDTEHVLVDGPGLSPARIAQKLRELVDDLAVGQLTGGTLISLPKGAWCDVEAWQPFEDRFESGADMPWDINVNGGGWRDTEELTREVFERLCAGTDWRLAVYVEGEVVTRRE